MFRLFETTIDEYPVLMSEIEEYERMYKYSFSKDTKSELMRIANSKLGQRAIKIAFKLFKLIIIKIKYIFFCSLFFHIKGDLLLL